jgi:hypothetical protein
MPKEKCAYCLTRDVTTREHVVARAFFPTQPPDNLTIPACEPCNSGTGDGFDRPMSQDEEYVRTVLAYHAGSWGHAAADELVRGKIIRSFTRRPDGLPKMLERNLRPLGIEKPGIWFPDRSTMEVDGLRVSRVLRKITKGLFYIHNEFPLPADCDVYVEPKISPPEFYETLEVFKLCGHMPPSMRGDGVFWHVGIRDPANRATTIWLMVFYERVASMTVTAKHTIRHIDFKDPNHTRPLFRIDLERPSK